jgi:hypothetical protein
VAGGPDWSFVIDVDDLARADELEPLSRRRGVDDRPDVGVFAGAVGEVGLAATDPDEVQRGSGCVVSEMERRFEDPPGPSADKGDHRV